MPLHPRSAKWLTGLLILALACAGTAIGAPPQRVRVGVLQSGTAQWELDVMHHHGLDAAQNVAVSQLDLVGKDAPAVALQAGSVDVILTDFIWVSRQRRAGADYVFVPHSAATGAIMVRPDAAIATPADLRGRKIGVAGNPVDKSWLLFRAYGRHVLGADPARSMHPVFGTPPLLNALVERNEFPAVLNFWNYTARLKARGYLQLLTVRQMMAALDMPDSAPLLGWVFSAKWAAAHPGAIEGFIRASIAAQRVMASSDAEWDRLRPLTRAENDATLIALRDAYRAGIVTHYDPVESAAVAEKLFHVLAEIGGKDVTGGATDLAPGTFWAGIHF